MNKLLAMNNRDATLILGPTLSGKSSVIMTEIILECLSRREPVILFTHRKDVALGIWCILHNKKKRSDVLHLKKASYDADLLQALFYLQDNKNAEGYALLNKTCFETIKEKSIASIFDFEESINKPCIKDVMKYMFSVLKANKRAITVICDDVEEYQDAAIEFMKFTYDYNIRLFLLTKCISLIEPQNLKYIQSYVSSIIYKGASTCNRTFIEGTFGTLDSDCGLWTIVHHLAAPRGLTLTHNINAFNFIDEGKNKKRKNNYDMIKQLQLMRFVMEQTIHVGIGDEPKNV